MTLVTKICKFEKKQLFILIDFCLFRYAGDGGYWCSFLRVCLTSLTVGLHFVSPFNSVIFDNVVAKIAGIEFVYENRVDSRKKEQYLQWCLSAPVEHEQSSMGGKLD